MKTGELKTGQIGLIQQRPDGIIQQIGLNESQSAMLHLFLEQLCKEKPLVRMPNEYNLKLTADLSSENGNGTDMSKLRNMLSPIFNYLTLIHSDRKRDDGIKMRAEIDACEAQNKIKEWLKSLNKL